jgi:hypothetical protein
MRRGYRRLSGKRKPGPIKALDHYAEATLAACAEQWESASGLDTAIRDDVAQGLAYLVYSAYDSISCSRGIGFGADDYVASYAFISGSTAEWFRQRGFAEWFCRAAGCLFNNQRPRIKSEMVHIIRRRRPAPKKRSAA